MWTTLCGHGYPDIGLSGLCGQPSVGTDIRTLGTQGYVDSPLRIRISGYWSLRAMWTTLCGHGYLDIRYTGLCGQPPAETDQIKSQHIRANFTLALHSYSRRQLAPLLRSLHIKSNSKSKGVPSVPTEPIHGVEPKSTGLEDQSTSEPGAFKQYFNQYSNSYPSPRRRSSPPARWPRSPPTFSTTTTRK